MTMRLELTAAEKIPPTRMEAIQSDVLRNLLPGLYHGFTTAVAPVNGRPFGQIVKDHLRGSTGGSFRLNLLKQDHSADILYLSGHGAVPLGDAVAAARLTGSLAHSAPFLPPRGDGAVIDGVTGGVVALQTADCVPVLAVHPGLGAVAALHAGWRGAARGILPNLMQRWQKMGEVKSIRIAFGPSIKACCYEVRGDCLAAFHPADIEGAVTHRGDRTYLELTRVLLNQAHRFGIGRDQVDILPQCTCCHEPERDGVRFASYRRGLRNGETSVERNASYIGLIGPGT